MPATDTWALVREGRIVALSDHPSTLAGSQGAHAWAGRQRAIVGPAELVMLDPYPDDPCARVGDDVGVDSDGTACLTMSLGTWLDRAGRGGRASLAEASGIPWETIHRVAKGRNATYRVAKAIERATGGCVRWTDLVAQQTERVMRGETLEGRE